MLGNSSRDINSLQKRRLYRCCALSIALYGFLLWYYNKAPTYYRLNILWKMQQRDVLWILDMFQTSSTLGIKAISRIIPIHLHLKKLYGRFLLQESSLLSNHIISSILITKWTTHLFVISKPWVYSQRFRSDSEVQ